MIRYLRIPEALKSTNQHADWSLFINKIWWICQRNKKVHHATNINGERNYWRQQNPVANPRLSGQFSSKITICVHFKLGFVPILCFWRRHKIRKALASCRLFGIFRVTLWSSIQRFAGQSTLFFRWNQWPVQGIFQQATCDYRRPWRHFSGRSVE